MFAARAFWIMRRNVGLLSGLGPPAFTAMAMSFPMRVKAFAILSHRLNMVALRVSKMRPMANGPSNPRARRREQRQTDRERRSAPGLALDRDGAAHGVDDLPHDPQAQPQAPIVAAGARPLEAPEDASEVVGGHADALVANDQQRRRVGARAAEPNLDRDRPACAVLDRVRQQVRRDLLEPRPIPDPIDRPVDLNVEQAAV